MDLSSILEAAQKALQLQTDGMALPPPHPPGPQTGSNTNVSDEHLSPFSSSVINAPAENANIDPFATPMDELKAEIAKCLDEARNKGRQLTDKWMEEVKSAEDDENGQQQTMKRPGSPVTASRVKVMITEFQSQQDSLHSLVRIFVDQVVTGLSEASTALAPDVCPSSSAAATERKSQALLNNQTLWNDQPPSNDKSPSHDKFPSKGKFSPEDQLSSHDKHSSHPQTTTRDARTPPSGPSQPPTPGENQKIFTLTLDEMGKNLTKSLQRFVQDEAFIGIINIDDPGDILHVSWEELKGKLQRRQAKETDATNIRYTRGDDEAIDLSGNHAEGWCYLYTNKTKASFKMPQYPQGIQEPTPAQATEFLNDLVDNPPDKPCTYYVGGSIDSQWDNLVDSGSQLADYSDALPGIRSVYWHVGDASSGTAMHHEDADFWSCNLTLVGFKMWILIDLNDNEKMHEFLKRHWVEPTKESTQQDCDQWARHLCLVFSPKGLAEEGIGHRVLITGPKQMVVTRPGEYHIVVNYSSSFAISTNLLLPDEPLFPETFSTCRDCGLYLLDDPANHKVDEEEDPTEKANETQTAPKATPTKKKSARIQAAKPQETKTQETSSAKTRSQRAVRNAVKQLREHDPKVRIAAKDEAADVNTFLLANIIRTRLAIKQFVSLVEEWRRQGAPQQRPPEGEETEFHIFERRLQVIDKATQGVQLGKLQVRAGEYHLALELAKSREVEGRERTNSALCRDICRTLGWKPTRLDTHRKHGNKWLALCDKGTSTQDYRPGLLCFISFGKKYSKFEKSHTHYLGTKGVIGVDPKSFARMLQGPYIDAICKAGEELLEALEGSREVKFQFEEETDIDWDNIEEDEIKRLLRQVGEKAKDEDMSDGSVLTDLMEFELSEFSEGDDDESMDDEE